MPTPVKEMIGKRFGRWTVIERAENTNRGQTRWVCQCDCGSTKTCMGLSLRSGSTTSCGCYQREWASNQFSTHGMTHTPEHKTWLNMRRRCSDPKSVDYKNYGARGIKVCERWRDDFSTFFADVGTKPTPKHTLERKDNDGDYEPGNCYWATRQVQMRNNRHNHVVTYKGAQMALVEAVEAAGSIVAHSTARARLKRGWTIEAAVETPVDDKHP